MCSSYIFVQSKQYGNKCQNTLISPTSRALKLRPVCVCVQRSCSGNCRRWKLTGRRSSTRARRSRSTSRRSSVRDIHFHSHFSLCCAHCQHTLRLRFNSLCSHYASALPSVQCSQSELSSSHAPALAALRTARHELALCHSSLRLRVRTSTWLHTS